MDNKSQLTNEARAEGKLACTMPCKEEEDESQIEALYKQMYRTMIAKDIAVLDTILDDRSVLVHMTGTCQTKHDYLREIRNGTLNYYQLKSLPRRSPLKLPQNYGVYLVI